MSKKIDALLEQRGSSWGNAANTHSRIAQVWSGILDTEVTAGQVALCMAGLKLVRASVNPDDPDSFDDGHGYLAIAEDIFGHKKLAIAEDIFEHKKPAHEIQSITTLMGAPCFHVSCTGEQNHRHGSQCTSTCECGLGAK